MANQELVDYIKDQLQKGKTKEEIMSVLKSAGWKDSDIQESFNLASPAGTPPPAGSVQAAPTHSTTQTATEFAGPIELLTSSLELFKNRFWTLLGVVAIPTIVTFIMVAILAGGILAKYLMSGRQASSLTNSGTLIYAVVAYVIFFIVSLIVNGWGQTSLIYAIAEAENNLGIVDAYKKGWKKILSYWWVMFLGAAVTFGGFLLLFVPGIIIAIWFMFDTYVLLTEDVRGLNALIKSREYIRDKWFAVFGRLLFLALIIVFLYAAPSLALEKANLPIVSSIYSLIASSLIPPVMVIYLYKMYENLKALKGSFEFAPTKGTRVKYIILGVLGVLVIPGSIIAVVLLVAINPARQLARTRDANRKFEAQIIQTSLQNYYVKNNIYPMNLDQLAPEYFDEVPKDPATKAPYEYFAKPDGSDYQLCVTYEEKAKECYDSSKTNVNQPPPDINYY